MGKEKEESGGMMGELNILYDDHYERTTGGPINNSTEIKKVFLIKLNQEECPR
jgi:hypothetical protein